LDSCAGFALVFQNTMDDLFVWKMAEPERESKWFGNEMEFGDPRAVITER